MKRWCLRVAAVFTLGSVTSSADLAGQTPAAAPLNADAVKGIAIRSIGPGLVTGRIADIEIDPRNSNVWYVATAFGGLWKTVNRGVTFTPIFDDGPVHALLRGDRSEQLQHRVARHRARTTASAARTSVKASSSRRTRARTWKRVGLESSEHIGKIVIDPRNSNIVYVAAQGPLFSAGGERGLYKTTDGGATWNAILTVSENTGISDLVIDPNNPEHHDRVGLSAAAPRRSGHWWRAGSGHLPFDRWWQETGARLTTGLPTGDMGRTGLAIDGRKNPDRDLRTGRSAARGNRASIARLTVARRGRRHGRNAPGRGRARRRAEVVAVRRTRWRGASGYRSGGGRGGAPATPTVNWMATGTGQYYSELFVDPHRRRPHLLGGRQHLAQHGRRRDVGTSRLGRAAAYTSITTTSRSIPMTRITSCSATTAACTRPTMRARPGASSPTCRSRSTTASASTTRSRSTCVRRHAGQLLAVRSASRTTNNWGIRTSDWFIIAGGDGFQARGDMHDQYTFYGESQNGGLSRFDMRTGRGHGHQLRMERPRSWGWWRWRCTTWTRIPFRVDAAVQVLPQTHRRPVADGLAAGAGRGWWWWRRRAWRWRSRELGCAVHRESALADATLLRHAVSCIARDNRGDNWTRISPDLSRNLRRDTLPIMGKVWPAGSVALNGSTTALSNVVTLDESPLLEGLILAGTDDGLVQITEDGGKNWRRVDTFPGVPKWTYVTDVLASPRDANTIFVTLNNWQRGDYKPYVVKSTDRGRTWTQHHGRLARAARRLVDRAGQGECRPALRRHRVRFVLHAQRRAQLGAAQGWHAQRAGARRRHPGARIRCGDGHVRTRFLRARRLHGTARSQHADAGRGSATLPAPSRLLVSAGGLAPAGSAGIGNLSGNYTTPNPPLGAWITYNVRQAYPADTRLVLKITDASGTQVRRCELDKSAGLRRFAWGLTGDPAPENAANAGRGGGGRGGAGGAGGAAADSAGRGGGAGAAAATPAPALAGTPALTPCQPAAGRTGGPGGGGGGGGGGRGGAGGGTRVQPGLYRASIEKVVGTTVTPIGPSQSFNVLLLPDAPAR